MPTNTYVALDKVTVSGSTTNTVTFSSIPATYTDLVIVANGYTLTADISQRIRFNSDTGTNYSLTYLGGNGSTASSGRTTSGTGIYANYLTGWTNSSTQPSNWIFQVMNYSNSTTYKTVLSRANTATGGSYPGTEAIVGLWRSTAAITSISIEAGYSSTHYFASGSTFSLYGIAAQSVGTAKATGGTITYDGYGNVIHTFTSTGTFTPSQALTCDYLVVAGGGGGGRGAYGNGGGGGAGGLRSTVTATGGGGTLESALSVTAQAYTITVGGGGAGGSGSGSSGVSGTNSTFSTITSTGGGGGGAAQTDANRLGKTGGSGGGGGGTTGVSGTGGAGTANQGFTGGDSPAGSPGAGGGGGGGAGAAGTIGGSGNSGAGGAGGTGVAVAINRTSTTYAGGGGGSSEAGSGGSGGSGGGGAGASGAGGNGSNGTANTGGGGGSGYNAQGAGGSGIVIIRYSGL